MAASPYDLSNVPGAHKKRRGLVSRLPKIGMPRVAALGGGLGLLVVALGLLAIGLGWNGMAGGGGQVSGVTLLQGSCRGSSRAAFSASRSSCSAAP